MTLHLGRPRRALIAALLAAGALTGPAAAEEAVSDDVRACLDVVGGGGSVERKPVVVAGVPTSLASDDVTVAFQFELAAPSCTNGTYEVVFRTDDGAVLPASTTFAGDGATSTYQYVFDIPGYAHDGDDLGRCVGVDVLTRNPGGNVKDAAPDTAPRSGGLADLCEGGGGAVTSWR